MLFVSTPPAYIFLRICMGLEGSGMLNGAWVVGWIHKKIARYKQDEIHTSVVPKNVLTVNWKKIKRIYHFRSTSASCDLGPKFNHRTYHIHHSLLEAITRNEECHDEQPRNRRIRIRCLCS